MPDPAAFLVDEDRRVAADAVAQIRGQRPNLIGAVAVALEENEAERVAVAEERPLSIAEKGALAAEDRCEGPGFRHRCGRTTRQSAPRDLIAWQIRPALSASSGPPWTRK